MSERTDRPEGHQSVGHPISVVAARTGLSRDVLRVWERRYGAVEPMRTAGGQRLYSDEHVHRFRLLASATRHGRNISHVAGLGTDALERLVADDDAALPPVATGPASPSTMSHALEAAMVSIGALDSIALDSLLRRLIAREGTSWFLAQLAPTLMQAVGDAWAVGRFTVAHEHLASATVLAIILETIRAIPPVSAARRLVVATPSGERHAVGAALAAAAASVEGWSIVYLGPDVPAADIAAAAAVSGASAVALSVVYVQHPPQIVDELRALRDILGRSTPLFIGGAGVEGIASDIRDLGVTICSGLDELRAALVRMTNLS